MPKVKTHKGLKKRVRVSANGKVLFKKSFSGHLMSGKSGNRCRRLRKVSVMFSADAKRARMALQE